MTRLELISIARYYLEHEISLKQLASKNKISKTTLIRYFNGEQAITLPQYLQEQIDDKKKKRFYESKSTCGNSENTILNQEQIIICAKLYIENDITMDELVDYYKKKGIVISKSTLSNYFTEENLGQELFKKVVDKINLNKQNAIRRINGS